MELNDHEEIPDLVQHDDFDFDGYEDLELLRYHVPHLGKSIFCVYLWDEKAQRFRYEPQMPTVDPVAHPETKTITTHEEWIGGTWGDAVYIWLGDKLAPIAEWGLANEAGLPETNADCPWTAWCSNRIDGTMRKVVTKSTGCFRRLWNRERSSDLKTRLPEKWTAAD